MLLLAGGEPLSPRPGLEPPRDNEQRKKNDAEVVVLPEPPPSATCSQMNPPAEPRTSLPPAKAQRAGRYSRRPTDLSETAPPSLLPRALSSKQRHSAPARHSPCSMRSDAVGEATRA